MEEVGWSVCRDKGRECIHFLKNTSALSIKTQAAKGLKKVERFEKRVLYPSLVLGENQAQAKGVNSNQKLKALAEPHVAGPKNTHLVK